jgi:signal peptidase I
VIVLPGDRLEAKNGHPWINGWEVPHCLVGVYSYNDIDTPSGRHEGDLFVEFLEDEAYLTLYDHASAGFPEHQGPFVAQPGEVWVMGDAAAFRSRTCVAVRSSYGSACPTPASIGHGSARR